MEVIDTLAQLGDEFGKLIRANEELRERVAELESDNDAGDRALNAQEDVTAERDALVEEVAALKALLETLGVSEWSVQYALDSADTSRGLDVALGRNVARHPPIRAKSSTGRKRQMSLVR